MKATIELVGCDDITTFTIETTPEIVTLLQEVAAKSREASSYRCEPVMRVEVDQ